MYLILLTLLFSVIGCKPPQKSEFHFADGNYLGSVDKNGKKIGKGIYRWKDGSRYEGNFDDDVRSGKGRFLWSNGETYEGDYLKDERTGKGTYSWTDGSYYEGDFLSGKRHGNGFFISVSGDTYKGEWFDDLQHGEGILCFSNGQILKGIWRQGQLVNQSSPLLMTPKLSNLGKTELENEENTSSAIENQLPVEKNQSILDLKPTDKGKINQKLLNSELIEQKFDERQNEAILANTIRNQTPAEVENNLDGNKPLVEEKSKIKITEYKSENPTPDWTGTIIEAEVTFNSNIINGVETLTYKADGTLFTGIMKFVYDSGKTQGFMHLRDGVLHGESISLDSDGNLIEKEFWESGKLVEKEFWENGKLVTPSL